MQPLILNNEEIVHFMCRLIQELPLRHQSALLPVFRHVKLFDDEVIAPRLKDIRKLMTWQPVSAALIPVLNHQEERLAGQAVAWQFLSCY